MSPIQSPVLDTTCASHSRKYDRVPKIRKGAAEPGSSGRGEMNGAGGSALTPQSG